MKILVAVIGTNSTDLFKKTLSWAPRGGFNMRIFISEAEPKEDYLMAIDNANHEYYVDILPVSIIQGINAAEYAKNEGFDLLVELPDNMASWKPTDSEDGTVYHFAKDVGIARTKLAKYPARKEIRFASGAKVLRL